MKPCLLRQICQHEHKEFIAKTRKAIFPGVFLLFRNGKIIAVLKIMQ